MSWMQKLYDTYEQCSTSARLQSTTPLAPLCHVIQQAHIEIVIDGNGDFRRARVIEKENTIIPATEKSATARTSGVEPHALSDHVKYSAKDYLEEGQALNKHFEKYRKQLKAWCDSRHSHPKAAAILRYADKGTVVRDLVAEGVLPTNNGVLLTQWEAKKTDDKPPLFKQLTKDQATKEYKPQNALIRWIVESDDLVSETWKDAALRDAWIAYSNDTDAVLGLCMVTGTNQVLADKHPKGVRGGKDGAKLISYKKEKDSEFIYLGRFLEASQVVGVGSAVTQKAHSALRWLIERQGYRNGDQAIVAWAVAGAEIPDWAADTNALLMTIADSTTDMEDVKVGVAMADPGDVGQAYAIRLNSAMRGYRSNLGATADIVVLGLDSASKGRLAVTYFRELTGTEFLDRIETWHQDFAWLQDYGKQPKTKRHIQFIGSPSPRDIAETAFGIPKDKQHEKLIKATVERLLPCIVDKRPLPHDLVQSAVRRTCNRIALDHWEWEKTLGIACALFKGTFKNEEYQMSLEIDRHSRDYLYGRLLALAENIESYALTTTEKNRGTSAARLMQRFADHPVSTWRSIELALCPYKSRLRSTDKGLGFLIKREKLVDEIMSHFAPEDFLSSRSLTGEFLLGYHCQRDALKFVPKPEIAPPDEDTQIK